MRCLTQSKAPSDVDLSLPMFKRAQAEFAVELDLTKVTSGLGLEVDWADGKTLFIKSVKALPVRLLRCHQKLLVTFVASRRRRVPCLTGTRSAWGMRSLPATASFPSMARGATPRLAQCDSSPFEFCALCTPSVCKAMLAVCKKDKQLSLLVRTGSSNASTVEPLHNLRMPFLLKPTAIRQRFNEILGKLDCAAVPATSSKAVKKVASGIASAVQHSLAALPSTEDGGDSAGKLATSRPVKLQPVQLAGGRWSVLPKVVGGAGALLATEVLVIGFKVSKVRV